MVARVWSNIGVGIRRRARDKLQFNCLSTRTSFAYPTRSFFLPQRQSKPIQVQRKQEPTDRQTEQSFLRSLWRVCRAGTSQAAPTRSRPSRVKRFAQALYRTICSCSSDENNVIWCQKAMPRIAKLSCAKQYYPCKELDSGEFDFGEWAREELHHFAPLETAYKLSCFQDWAEDGACNCSKFCESDINYSRWKGSTRREMQSRDHKIVRTDSFVDDAFPIRYDAPMGVSVMEVHASIFQTQMGHQIWFVTVCDCLCFWARVKWEWQRQRRKIFKKRQKYHAKWR